VKRALAILVAAWLCGLAPAAEPSVESQPDGPSVALPLTVDKLWYRAGGKRRQGDLIVSEDGFELVAKKRAFSIPLDRIQFISYGEMKGDVDTEWVLLTVGVSPPYDLVGLRDGKKWGYGGRTKEVYQQLRRALEQLAAGQFRVAPGYQAYEGPDHGCALAIPEDWSTYLESLVVVAGRSAWGTTILSAQPIRTIETKADGEVRAVDDLELLDAILAGERLGFFIERGRASRGMSCSGFSESARERVLTRVRQDIAFGEDFEVLASPAATVDSVGSCEALHIMGRSRRPDGAELVLELYAAARGETLYLFGLRALADRYEDHRKTFAASIATIRFAVAAPR
jgi:hypothetical protein